MAPKPAQAPVAAIASPPRKWPMQAAAKRNKDVDSPPLVANWPISMNSGMTARS